MPAACWHKWHWLAKFKYDRALAYATVVSKSKNVQVKNDSAAPRGWISKIVNDHFYKKWSVQWQNTNSEMYRQTRLWFPHGARPEISKALVKKNRSSLGTIIQFMTGHGWLNRHRWLVDPSRLNQPSLIDPMCCLCGLEEEIPQHLWSSCPELQLERDQIPRDKPWQLKELDWFFGTTNIVLLLKQGQGEQEL